MKKYSVVCFLLSMVIFLSACSKEEKKPIKRPERADKTPAATLIEETHSSTEGTYAQTEPTPAETEKQADSYTDALISQLVCEQEVGENGLYISYYLPQIKADSPDAAEFNASMAHLQQQALEQGQILYDRITWDRYWNDSLLTMVVKLQACNQSDTDYFTWHYDFARGCSVSMEEILSGLSLTREQAEQALLRGAAEQFDLSAEELYRTYGDCYAAVAQMRAGTLSKTNLAPENVAMYLGEENSLWAAVELGTIAGGGYYRREIPLESARGSTVSLQASTGNITVTLEDNRAVLVASDYIPGQSFLSGENMEHGRPYPIAGLYGNYREISLSFLGNDGSLYLFLLDDRGRITCCSLSDGLERGGAFCAFGPLPSPEVFVALRGESDEGGYTASGITEDGREILLDDLVYSARMGGGSLISNTLWTTEDGIYQVSITGNPKPEVYMSWGGGGGLLADGILRYEGCSDKGLQYAAVIYPPEGGQANLLLTCSREDWYGETQTLIAENFGPAPVPSMEIGQPVLLQQSRPPVG